MQRLSRRQFVVGAGAAGLSVPLLGRLAGCGIGSFRAQEPARPVRLGYLRLVPPVGPSEKWVAAFFEGLRDHGYREGQNLVIEYRDAEGRPERYPELAAELVALPVDVIFAGGGPAAALAAKQATSTIPIVVPLGDLIGTGLVASLARPGGNVTGLTNFSSQLVGKRLDLLKEAVPGISRVAAIHNPTNPAMLMYLEQTRVAAGALGLAVQPLEMRAPADLEPAFEAAREGADAVVVLSDPLTVRNAARIAGLAAESRLPSMFQEREFAEAGGLMAYGPNNALVYRRAAYYVDRILKGAKPADLPVEQPMRFDFVVNMRTARALGITLPHEVALQITEVIE